MKTRIVTIGNSKGIRIPKVLLEQARLSGEVELEVQADKILITQVRGIRLGWQEAFQEMSARTDDQLIDSQPNSNTWDDQRWQW